MFYNRHHVRLHQAIVCQKRTFIIILIVLVKFSPLYLLGENNIIGGIAAVVLLVFTGLVYYHAVEGTMADVV